MWSWVRSPPRSPNVGQTIATSRQCGLPREANAGRETVLYGFDLGSSQRPWWAILYSVRDWARCDLGHGHAPRRQRTNAWREPTSPARVAKLYEAGPPRTWNFTTMQITDSSKDRKNGLLSTNALAAIMISAHLLLAILGGGSGETAVFAMVMIGGPLLIGLISQRVKGRTGAVWWLLSLILMMVVNLLAGGGEQP